MPSSGRTKNDGIEGGPRQARQRGPTVGRDMLYCQEGLGSEPNLPTVGLQKFDVELWATMVMRLASSPRLVSSRSFFWPARWGQSFRKVVDELQWSCDCWYSHLEDTGCDEGVP
jgi:hypothetical protein